MNIPWTIEVENRHFWINYKKPIETSFVSVAQTLCTAKLLNPYRPGLLFTYTASCRWFFDKNVASGCPILGLLVGTTDDPLVVSDTLIDVHPKKNWEDESILIISCFFVHNWLIPPPPILVACGIIFYFLNLSRCTFFLKKQRCSDWIWGELLCRWTFIPLSQMFDILPSSVGFF